MAKRKTARKPRGKLSITRTAKAVIVSTPQSRWTIRAVAREEEIGGAGKRLVTVWDLYDRSTKAARFYVENIARATCRWLNHIQDSGEAIQ